MNPNLFLLDLWRHRGLTNQMVRREVIGRYRGSMLGLLWSFVNPVLMLAVYTFIFSVVFKARWGAGDGTGSNLEFAVILFAGLIVFNLFSECLSRAPGLILSNVNYVKKVIFPLEILPLVSLGSALFHAAASLFVLVLFLTFSDLRLVWTVALFPLVLLPLLPLILGLSWLLASLGVFLRDVGQLVGLILTALMFLSPIFYPVSALPESVRDFIFLNPLSFIIEQSRSVLIFGQLPDWAGLAGYAAIAMLFALAGRFWFEKTRKGFPDVM